MSILKHVSGSNCDPDYINVLVDYMSENHKTADGLYVDTYGCSKTNPVRDIDAVKKIHHKTGGKQGEHFVLSITPDKPENTNASYMEIGRRIASYLDGFQSVYALHTDTDTRHLHFLVNSVSYKDGKKFTQGPKELNDFKTYCDQVLYEKGFDIIKKGNTGMFDNTPYSFKDGFDFLEVSEDTSEEKPEKCPIVICDEPENDSYINESERNSDESDICGCDDEDDYDDYEEDDYMSKDYLQELNDANDKKSRKLSKKKGKKKSNPTYTINDSSNYTLNVDSKDKLDEAAALISAIHGKKIEEKIEDTKLGMCTVAGFKERGLNVDVNLDISQNLIINLNYKKD